MKAAMIWSRYRSMSKETTTRLIRLLTRRILPLIVLTHPTDILTYQARTCNQLMVSRQLTKTIWNLTSTYWQATYQVNGLRRINKRTTATYWVKSQTKSSRVENWVWLQTRGLLKINWGWVWPQVIYWREAPCHFNLSLGLKEWLSKHLMVLINIVSHKSYHIS